MLVEMYLKDNVWVFKDANGLEWLTSLTESMVTPKEEKQIENKDKTVFKLLASGVKPKEIIALKEAELL